MMNIQSAFNSGVTGFNQASDRVAESANNIAQQQVRPVQNQTEAQAEAGNSYSQQRPVTDDLINLRVAENDARASARVIETADEVLGSLIDTRA